MCETCGCGGNKETLHNKQAHHSHNSHHHNEEIVMKESLYTFNDKLAAENRAYFRDKKICAVNILSGDGAGKTSLLIKVLDYIKQQKPSLPLFVIEGDLQTELDADRIKQTGVSAVQINTGTACHLDAHNIHHTVVDADLKKGTLLFIENVGNLVCPAAFDLGEGKRVVLLSVAEGDEKPLKYPHIFASADALVISKTDMAEVADFDVAKAKQNALTINPRLQIFETSAKTDKGVDLFCRWIFEQMKGFE